MFASSRSLRAVLRLLPSEKRRQHHPFTATWPDRRLEEPVCASRLLARSAEYLKGQQIAGHSPLEKAQREAIEVIVAASRQVVSKIDPARSKLDRAQLTRTRNVVIRNDTVTALYR